MTSTEFNHGTQAVDRASALLITILKSPTPLLLSALAKIHGLPKSTTSRLLAALIRQDLVERDRAGAFLAGQVLIHFAREQNQDSVLITRMRPILERLASKTGETSNLAIPGNGHINVIDQVGGHFLLGATNWVGRRVSYHASALGKVLLAYSTVAIPAGRLERATDKTIISRRDLLVELEMVRKNGYATIIDELETGLVAVAAPIRELDGRVIGAISISGPSTRLPLKDLRTIGAMIVAEIEARQGRSLLNSQEQKIPQRKLGKVGAA